MKKQSFLNKIYFNYRQHKHKTKTIIFIHGITGSSSAWDRYCDYFYRLNYNILKFDLRGHGFSLKSNKTSYYNIENLSEDIFKLLKNNRIEEPIFITHSFATLVLLDFIKNHPTYKISKIIFISPFYNLTFNSFNKLLFKFGTFLPIFRKKGYQIDYTQKFKNTKDFSFKRILVESLNTHLKVICVLFISVSNKNYFSVLPKIQCPVLLVHGKKDTISPYATSYKISKALNNCKIKLYDNLDHIIVLNNYKDIIKDLENFIQN